MLTRTVAVFLLAFALGMPNSAGAQDRWLGADKAGHFSLGAGAAAGGYIVAAPLTRSRRWRIAVSITGGLGTATAKELRDRSHGGTPSWRDFTWAAAGTATGVLLAWTIDKLND